MRTLLEHVLRCIDYLVAILTVILCLLVFVITMPWALNQRKRWNLSARGNHKVLIIQGFSAKELKTRGFEFLLPFRNPVMNWVGFFDPVNSLNEDVKVRDDLFVMARRLPNTLKFTKAIGLEATSIVIREFYVVYKLVGICVREKVGILRAYKHEYPALRAYLVSRLIGIPFIVDITGNYELIYRLNGKLYYFRDLGRMPLLRIFAPVLANWLMGLPLKRAASVLGRNKNNYEHGFALGAPVEKLSLLRISNFNSVFNNYDPENLPPPPLPYPYLLYVGRLVLIKFPFDVIEAFEQAAGALPDYRLVMIGDGALRDDVVARIESSAFKDRIVFTGLCSSDTVFAWTAHAKMSICPFSGYTLAEAMLCGIPVVAYDIENHSEVVIDNYSGFLVPFRNVKELAKTIVSVANDYENAKQIGLRGRELARIVYNKSRIMERESMVYSQALDSGRTNVPSAVEEKVPHPVGR